MPPHDTISLSVLNCVSVTVTSGPWPLVRDMDSLPMSERSLIVARERVFPLAA